MLTHQPLIKLGEPFIELLQVDSTNNYALAQVKNRLAVAGTCFFAHHQSNGKGQMGKKWQTTTSENIILSIVIDISTVYLQNQFSLVAMSALGCFDFFNKYAIDKTAIKWSNDLYWSDKKAGGILIETITVEQKRFAIVGIGININQTSFDEQLPNPVSLKQITGKNYNIVELAKELCCCISYWHQKLLNNQHKELLDCYNKVLYKKNELVRFKHNNVVFDATVKSVNAFGELEIQRGTLQCCRYGELEWLINS